MQWRISLYCNLLGTYFIAFLPSCAILMLTNAVNNVNSGNTNVKCYCFDLQPLIQQRIHFWGAVNYFEVNTLNVWDSVKRSAMWRCSSNFQECLVKDKRFLFLSVSFCSGGIDWTRIESQSSMCFIFPVRNKYKTEQNIISSPHEPFNDLVWTKSGN